MEKVKIGDIVKIFALNNPDLEDISGVIAQVTSVACDGTCFISKKTCPPIAMCIDKKNLQKLNKFSVGDEIKVKEDIPGYLPEIMRNNAGEKGKITDVLLLFPQGRICYGITCDNNYHFWPEEYLKKSRWKPKDGERYYSVSAVCDSGVQPLFWTDDPLDSVNYGMGNVFKTRAEAEEKWKKINKILMGD